MRRVWTPKQRHIIKVVKIHKKAKDDLFSQPNKSSAGKKKKR